jgi:DNA-binding NtrC family response regulator
MAVRDILLVEDEDVIQRLCLRVLYKWDVDIAQARLVKEARALLASDNFRLLVTDLMLPDGHGTQVIKAFKDGNANGAVIVITGSLTPEVSEHPELQGLVQVIHKPFGIKDFQTAVTRCLVKPRWDK